MSARDRLIDATADELWKRGYTGTSPRTIQLTAGAGQGSMYHHFRGKADLAKAAIDQIAAEMTTEADAIFDGPGDPIDRIERWLFKPRDKLRGCRLGRLVSDSEVVDSAMLRGPIEVAFGHMLARLEALLTEASVTRGSLSVEAADMASLLLSSVQGGYILARASQRPETFDRSVRAAAALLRATYSTTQSRSGNHR